MSRQIRIVSMVMLFMTLLSLAAGGCGGAKNPPSTTDTPADTETPGVSSTPVSQAQSPTPSQSTSPTPSADADYAADPLGYFRANMPKIDGSTSLIPLEGGIRAVIFDIPLEEAEKQVAHSTTYGAFYNLVNGTCDLLLTVPLSAQQYADAMRAGVTLEEVPISREGFVFVVNYDNPVDTLTQEQLRGIYSGRITNWKQLGGNDEEIIAYQRDITSGSQNYMISFMGDVPLMDAPTELRPASMSGLMDVIAVNDNAAGAIGYSVYAYAADMYGNGKSVKFIKVDGVAPNKQTMAAGEYPLMSNNYVMFNANAAPDSPARRLAEWMVSYEGQLAIAEAGYVTVMELGFDYEEMTLRKWSGTGTGAARPKGESVPGYEFACLDSLPLREIRPEDKDGLVKGVTYELNCLTDKTLQSEVNRWIKAAMERADQKADDLAAQIERLNSTNEWQLYYYGDGMYSPEVTYPSANAAATAKNGYLFVTVTMDYMYAVQDGYRYVYQAESAAWDMLSGKKLEVSDLFYQGVDVDEVLNRYISEASQKPIDAFGVRMQMKRDFAGLPETGWTMTADAIYFGKDNPYFGNGAAIPYQPEEGLLACEQPRDMTQCFETGLVLVGKHFRKTEKHKVYESLSDGFASCALLDEDAYPTAKKINDTCRSLIETYCRKDKVVSYFTDLGVSEEDIPIWGFDWYLEEYTGRFVRFYHWSDGVMHKGKTYVYPYLSQPMFFDLRTGEELDWRTLVDANWLSRQRPQDDSGKSVEWGNLILEYVDDREVPVLLRFQEKGNSEGPRYSLLVPREYINW